VLTVYAIPISLYCAKLRILLRHKDLKWREIDPPGGYGSGKYKKIVPSGNLPALIDDGLQIADSEAIAEYLNEVHPEPPMLPDVPGKRAKVRERSRFHDTRLEPALRAVFPQLREKTRDRTLIDAQAEAITARLGQLAVMLADNLVTEDAPLTLGDCGYPVTLTWIEALGPILGMEVAVPGAVADYLAALRAHKAVADELDDYAPKLKRWLGQF